MSRRATILGEILSRHTSVRIAYLFGSVARGEERFDSDLDLAIMLEPGAGAGVVAALEADIERYVDCPVHMVDLRSAPPLLLREIVREGRVIGSCNEDERAEFEMRALAEYRDTARLRQVQYTYLRARAKEHRRAQA